MSDTSKHLSLPVAHVLDPRLSQVLEYWLGAELPTNESALARKTLWFTKSEEVDEEIRHLFGAVLQRRWRASWMARRWSRPWACWHC
nr:hypothetical protein [Comamonas jiangduensis]